MNKLTETDAGAVDQEFNYFAPAPTLFNGFLSICTRETKYANALGPNSDHHQILPL